MLTVNSRAAGVSAQRSPLHSLLSDCGSLEPAVPLPQNDFRPVLLDLRGFGESPAGAGSLGALTDQIADAAGGFCGDEAPILFGNGYGSFLALALARHHPSSARDLCLAGCGIQ